MVRSQLLPTFLSVMLAFTFCVPIAYADGGLRAAAAGGLTAQSANIASGTCGTCTWVINKDGLLTIKPTNGKKGKLPESTGNAADLPWWKWAEDNHQGLLDDFWLSCPIKSVKIANGVKAGKSIKGMFSGMGLVYNYCHYDSVDLSGLDTSITENMSELFRGTKIDKRAYLDFNTGSVTDMSMMFMNARFVNGWGHANGASGWDTSNVHNMNAMFWGYNPGGTTHIIIDSEMPNVEDMTGMFLRASFWEMNLQGLDNTRAICTEMFSESYWSKKLSVGPKLDFSRLDALPQLIQGGNWWSFKDQKWYTPEQVKASRSGIADTYYSTEVRDLAKGSLSLSKSGYTYDGAGKTPGVAVKFGSKALKKGADYTVAYKNNKSAGKATVTVTGKGSYAGTLTKSFAIAKAANPMSVAAKSPGVKYSKKARAVKATAAYTFKKKAVGAVTYARVAKGSSKWLPSVNKKTGAITVKAGAPKGKTQAVKVKVTAAGNANYKPLSKTVTVKVKVS